MLNEKSIGMPPLLLTGKSWKDCGLTKSKSSKAPFLILWEYLLVIKKKKKLISANIERKLASIDYVPI